MRKPDSRRPHGTPPTPPLLTRRRFVQALGAAGALFGSGARLQAASGTLPAPEVLRGTEFDLVIEESSVNLTGRTRSATTINGSFPAPTLVWREGDTVTLRVHNRLREDTSIHWHGIILPYEMDGVPGLSFAGIAPGTTFTYSFTVQQHGTYWYHSHTGDQKVTGMYGALIIEPRDGEHLQAERDYIVQLSDWSDTDMLRVFRSLKQQSDVYNLNKPTFGDFLRDVRRTGLDEALTRRTMWQQMRMNPTDLADVSGAVLSFLLNGRTPEQPWTELFKDIAANKCTCSAHCENFVNSIALSLVVLCRFEASPTSSVCRQTYSNFKEMSAVVPPKQFWASHHNIGTINYRC